MQRSGTWIIAVLAALAAFWLAGATPASAAARPGLATATSDLRHVAPGAPAQAPRAILPAQALDESGDPDDGVAEAGGAPPMPGAARRAHDPAGATGAARPRLRRFATGPPRA